MSFPSEPDCSHGGARRPATFLLLAFAAIALQACVAVTGGPPAAALDREQTAKQLVAQADAWDRAIVRKDRAAVEANMAEDFRHIDGSGNTAAKAEFLENILSADLEIDPYSVEDFDLRIYGDVALLCGRTRMTGRYQGKMFTSHYRYIDTYVLRDGKWRVVSVQITKMQP